MVGSMMVKLTAASARLGRPAGIAVAALLALPAQSAPQDFPASASFAQLAGTSGCLVQPGFENGEGCARARAVRAATALEVTPDQRQVYVVSGVEPDGSNAIAGFARQQATGALTAAGCVSDAGGDGRVGTDGFCTDGDALRGASDLAITPDGRFVYVVASSSSGVTWFERDATTAALTQRGCLIVFARGDRRRRDRLRPRPGDGRAARGDVRERHRLGGALRQRNGARGREQRRRGGGRRRRVRHRGGVRRRDVLPARRRDGTAVAVPVPGRPGSPPRLVPLGAGA